METEIDELSDYNRSLASNETSPFFHVTFGFYFRELIKVLVFIAAIISSFLVGYAIIKLRKFREPKFFYLFNWSIFSIPCLLISPFVSILVHYVLHQLIEYQGLICLILQLESAFLFVIYTSVILLTVDWIIENFFNQTYYNLYKNKIIFIQITYYVFAFLYLWYSSIYCLSNWREIHHTTLLHGLEFLLFYIILLHVLHYINSRRRNLLLKQMDIALLLPTGFLLCWLPYLCAHILIEDSSTGEFWFVCAYFFAECFAFGNTIVNAYLLADAESEFRTKFLEVIKCQCRNQAQSQYYDVPDSNAKC